MRFFFCFFWSSVLHGYCTFHAVLLGVSKVFAELELFFVVRLLPSTEPCKLKSNREPTTAANRKN